MNKIIKVLLIIILLLLLIVRFIPFEIDDYQGQSDLSTISFNLRYDEPDDGNNNWENRKEACIAMLKKEQPKVFGIQEGLHHQVMYLNDNLPNYNFVGVGRDDGDSSGEYAAIFYDINRFELLDNGNFWLSETPDVPSLGWDASNIRICTWVKLKDIKKNIDIYVFNTHFDHKGKTAQEKSSELIVSKIKEIGDEKSPVFISGDFNLLIKSSRIEPLTTNYFSAKHSAKITDNNGSFNGFGLRIPRPNIDFIFYENAQCLAYKTLLGDYGVPYISDHYPILSHFNYK